MLNYNKNKEEAPKSIELVEVRQAMKIYTPYVGSSLWVDFNKCSITCQVTDSIDADPVLIEIMYQSIRNWSFERGMKKEVLLKISLSTLFYLDLMRCMFLIQLCLINGTAVEFAVADLEKLERVKSILVAKLFPPVSLDKKL